MRSKIFIYITVICLILTGCKEKEYTVSFDTVGGSVIESITLKKGSILKDIIAPTKDGYLFVNWLKDGVEYDISKPVTENLILTASWVEKPELYEYYTITFIVEGQIEKTTVKENEKVNPLKAPEKEGYTFIGWYSGDEIYDFNQLVTKNISLTAKYESNVVTVTYDLDGGIGLSLEIIDRGTQLTVPEPPTKEGYRFKNWTLNENEFTFDTKVTKDITLKAQWTKIEYIIVQFDTAGGSGLSHIKLEKYSKINKLPTPVKEGYKFIGWELDGQMFDIETQIENDLILIAKYEIENN